MLRRMTTRGRGEEHRTATPLELFFDLCFVVAVAQAGRQLVHALAEGHPGHGVQGYAMIFFAVWWAWMNFTWFSSAYDTDDVPFRVVTLVQIAGVLVLAAGIPRAFDSGDYRAVWFGYLVMRLAMVTQWLRAALSARGAERRTALRYAIGVWPVPGRLAGPVVPAGRRQGVAVPGHGGLRDGRPRLGRARAADRLASAPHRRAVRAVHDHRARRDGLGGDGRGPVGRRRAPGAGARCSPSRPADY
ncbi:hypothetical protein GCM10020221_06100 [Streptomyces thioluteus]|uniref:Low temperature requirement protein A n=1 Tax=Streptomyces thioluteus TaxID=66431 RepID=A0ABP6IXL3_STRTU